MSRIGNKPVPIISGVKVALEGRTVKVEGPVKPPLSYELRPEVDVQIDDGKEVVITRKGDSRQARAYHGLTRALINSMVIGASKGYEKRLEIVGVGYLAAIKGDSLELRVGFANEIKKRIPEGLVVTCPDQTHISIKGSDKQKVGQFAAEVRAVRKPEPYKGKGIRYEGEHVKIKPGKTAT